MSWGGRVTAGDIPAFFVGGLCTGPVVEPDDHGAPPAKRKRRGTPLRASPSLCAASARKERGEDSMTECDPAAGIETRTITATTALITLPCPPTRPISPIARASRTCSQQPRDWLWGLVVEKQPSGQTDAPGRVWLTRVHGHFGPRGPLWHVHARGGRRQLLLLPCAAARLQGVAAERSHGDVVRLKGGVTMTC